MHAKPGRQPESLDGDIRAGYAKIEIGLRPIVLFIVVLVASTSVLQVLLGMQLSWFSGRESPSAGAVAPLPPLKDQPPEEPKIQDQPAFDLVEMRRRDREDLESFGWVDRGAGTVRIPIEDAIRLVAEKGLPEWKPAAPAGGKAPDEKPAAQ